MTTLTESCKDRHDVVHRAHEQFAVDVEGPELAVALEKILNVRSGTTDVRSVCMRAWYLMTRSAPRPAATW